MQIAESGIREGHSLRGAFHFLNIPRCHSEYRHDLDFPTGFYASPLEIIENKDDCIGMNETICICTA